VRFIQLYHWDGILMVLMPRKALNSDSTTAVGEVDQPTGALLADLKERGLLEGHAASLGWRIWPHADA
jgi:hypothetical protein